MRFTVLGASGFIGRSLASHLRDEGHEVFAPARNDEGRFRGFLGHVIYCIGLTADFRNRPFDTVRAHVSVLSDVLEQADFTSLLYLSSTRVYSKASETSETAALPVATFEPSDLYNSSKLMGESLCLNSGRNGMRIARLSNVVGFDPGSDNFLPALIREALAGTIALRSALNSSKDYVALEDVLAILPRIAVEGLEPIYNVASGQNIRNGDLTKQLKALTGCSVQVAEHAPVQRFPPIRIERLRQEFHFSPSSPLERLPDLVAAYRRGRDAQIANRIGSPQ
jgi:nucleoside-diphosphate-sugar epimerase